MRRCRRQRRSAGACWRWRELAGGGGGRLREVAIPTTMGKIQAQIWAERRTAVSLMTRTIGMSACGFQMQDSPCFGRLSCTFALYSLKSLRPGAARATPPAVRSDDKWTNHGSLQSTPRLSSSQHRSLFRQVKSGKSVLCVMLYALFLPKNNAS